jgi:hypothetical protein
MCCQTDPHKNVLSWWYANNLCTLYYTHCLQEMWGESGLFSETLVSDWHSHNRPDTCCGSNWFTFWSRTNYITHSFPSHKYHDSVKKIN